MKYFKNNPIFSFVFFILLAAFIGGLGYSIYLFSENGKLNDKYRKTKNAYKKVLSIDPSQQSIENTEKNIANLNKKIDFLVKDLGHESENMLKPFATVNNGYELTESLRALRDKWRNDAKNKGIIVSSEMEFGYKRYVEDGANPPEDSQVPAIMKQASIMNYIVEKLWNSKTENSPMTILTVQREILPQETNLLKEADAKTSRRNRRGAQTQISNTSDTFAVPEGLSAKKEGSIITNGYRIVFAGHTEALRRFLNQIKDFDVMLVVRSVEVKKADMSVISSVEQTLNGAEAGANAFEAQSAPPTEIGVITDMSAVFANNTDVPAQGQEPEEQIQNRDPVVQDNISEFTIVLEYIEVIRDQAKKVEDKKAENNQ